MERFTWYATVAITRNDHSEHFTSRGIFDDPRTAWAWVCHLTGEPQGTHDKFFTDEGWADDDGVLGGGTVVSQGKYTAQVRRVDDTSTCHECGRKLLD